MTHHNPTAALEVGEARRKIVLAGNPNVGKSVFFNALTGIYVDVSNFPGTTVDITHGKYQEDIVIDTPGVYGVSSFNDEERVARDVILYGDVILNIVDASHLERDLFLTQQILDMGKPVVVALNMMDDVTRNGFFIDVARLSDRLGVEVIPTVAVQGLGMSELKEAIGRARSGYAMDLVKMHLPEVLSMADEPSEALLMLEEDENILERHKVTTAPKMQEALYKARRHWIDAMVEDVVVQDYRNADFKVRMGRWMIQPVTGIPILMASLWVMYQLVGVIIAQTVVDFTEGIIMGTYYLDWITGITAPFVTDTTLIGRLLIGEFGILTMTPVYILGLLMPLVIGFYLFLSVMEDSGYLPRVATLVDRLLNGLGLNGRAIIPMILGFGCVTMATITTRILGSKRERFIATMLLGLAIPCSAQLGVIAGLIAPLGPKILLIYVGTIVAVFVITGTLLNKLMAGESTALFIDIPPLRLPRISNVLRKTWNKSLMFLKEAAPLFAVGAVIITLLQASGLLEGMIRLATPLTRDFLRLDPQVTQAFIMGIIRRDFGAAGLDTLASQGLLSPMQLLVSLVAITLFVPCAAAVIVIFKERSWRESALIWIGSFIISFLTAGLLAQIVL
ncbi:MAG: ferrous iron transport protein B [Bacillota bacterium]|nr:ferrous iron transport protein B [Bacillota bacterium]MDW7676630.1 ferrous iron transport protein B [Bacillota bacterium]